ncbi:MAG TPA: hypothetical protein VGN16_09430 [Acidobacteriaceae bacterium]|jgi:hypothetical protein
MAAAALQAPPSPLIPPNPAANPMAPAMPVETVTSSADKGPKPYSQGELKQKNDTLEDKLDAINSSTGALQPPKFDVPGPPEPKHTDPSQVWGSAAMVLAAAGSMLSRQHLTTAMNAMAGVMKAAKANDMEQAQQDFERWKASSELAIKQQNFQMEAYKAALAKANTDSRTAIAEFTAYAHAFGDNTAVELGKQRNTQALERLMIDRQRLTNQMQANMPKIIQGAEFVQAYKSPEFQAKMQAEPDPQKKMAMVVGLQGGLTPEALDMLSDQTIASGSLPTGFARSAGGQAAIANMVGAKLKEKNLTGADLAARKATYQGLTASMRTLGNTSARIGLGVSELKNLEPQVRKASDELKRSGYPSLNAAIQAGQRESGNAELRNLAVRLQGLKSAFSQVLTRGGVPTDSARATTDELFSTKDPNNVLEASLAAMNDEASAIEKAPGDVRQSLEKNFGGTGGKKNKYLSPDSVKNAVKSGKITAEEGMQILQDDFGFDK